MMRILSCLVLFLAASLTSWSQAQVDGIQPSAVNGITVASGSALNGITLTAPGGGGGGTPTYVNSNTTGTASASTITLTGITAGNALIVTFYSGAGSGATLTFTDSLGNTFATKGSVSLATDGDTVAIGCAVITTGGSDTISFLSSGSNTGGRATVYEYSNTTCTADATAVVSNTTGATTCNSGAITTSTANDLLITACGNDGSQTSAMTAGSGWAHALSAANAGAYFIMSETQVATSPGSFTGTSGSLTTAMEQGSVIVALRP